MHYLCISSKCSKQVNAMSKSGPDDTKQIEAEIKQKRRDSLKSDYLERVLLADVQPLTQQQFVAQDLEYSKSSKIIDEMQSSIDEMEDSPEKDEKEQKLKALKDSLPPPIPMNEYPTQLRAMILIQQCQTKNAAGTKVHDPKQVINRLGDAIAGMQGKDPKDISKALNNAEEILIQAFKLSGRDYADLTVEGSELNNAYKDMLEKISTVAPKDVTNNFSQNIEKKCDNSQKNSTDAKATCDQLIETKHGKKVTSVNDFIAELNPRFLIGGYSQSKFKTMAKDIAHDLTQYQVNQVNSSGVSESGLNQQAPFFNGISNTIATDILQSDNPQHMENKVRLYIAVARECVKNNDFVSAHAIQSALNQGPVDRLKLADNLPRKPRSELAELNELFSLSGGMGNMKEAIAAVAPDQPLLQSNTTMLGEYTGALENADFVKSRDPSGVEQELYNEDKAKIMAKTVLPAVANKSKLEGFKSEPPKTDFVNLVFMGKKLTSEELYERSNHLKPRGQELDPSKFKDAPKLEGSQAQDLIALTSAAPAPPPPFDVIESLIEIDDPADMQEIDVDPNLDDDNVIYIGPGPGQEQKIGQEVPPLDLSQV